MSRHYQPFVILVIMLSGLAASGARLIAQGVRDTPGGGYVTVPNCVGKTQWKAVRVLRSRSLTPVLAREDTEHPAYFDRVIRTEPAPGSKVGRHSNVGIVMGRRTMHVVPDVVGKTRGEAEEVLRGKGFGVIVKKDDVDDLAYYNRVLGTAPAAGSKVAPGSRIEIIVGRKRMHIMPDVIGKTHDEAVRILEANSFRVKIHTRTADNSAQDNRVMFTSPRAWTRVKPGSTVRIAVGKYRQAYPSLGQAAGYR